MYDIYTYIDILIGAAFVTTAIFLQRKFTIISNMINLGAYT